MMMDFSFGQLANRLEPPTYFGGVAQYKTILVTLSTQVNAWFSMVRFLPVRLIVLRF